jgi:hypothetical protein
MEDNEGFALLKAFVIGLIALFLISGAVLSWMFYFGPLFNGVDYNNFNTSPTHMNAVAQKFSDDCLQLASTKDPIAKKAIEQDIYTQAQTVDLSKIVMPDTTRSCVTQAIQDVTHP